MNAAILAREVRVRSADTAKFARDLLPLLIALVYSGLERFFSTWSSALHYGFDVLLLACIAVGLLDGRLWDAMRPIWPYAIWIVFYFGWGLAISTQPRAVMGDSLRGFELNVLLLAGVSVSLIGRHNVRRLATLIQLAAVLNFVVGLIEISRPELITRIALQLNSNTLAFNTSRPAGLWSNPNEAAIALLFALLIAHWAYRPIQWLGWVAAIGGIYLSASRGGMYPLLLSIAVYCGFAIYQSAGKERLWRLGLVASSALVAIVIVLSVAVFTIRYPAAPAVSIGAHPGTLGSANASQAPSIVATSSSSPFAGTSPSPTNNAPGSSGKNAGYSIGRFANPFQTTPELGDTSRIALLKFWLSKAVHGHWYGSGIFTFQGNGRTLQGTHNIYLLAWGETGFIGALGYLVVISVGLSRLFRQRFGPYDLFGLSLMWLVYIVEGFLWHNQFTSVFGIVIVGLLFVLPFALTQHRGPSAPDGDRRSLPQPARA